VAESAASGDPDALRFGQSRAAQARGHAIEQAPIVPPRRGDDPPELSRTLLVMADFEPERGHRPTSRRDPRIQVAEVPPFTRGRTVSNASIGIRPSSQSKSETLRDTPDERRVAED